jgi:hypothetical protein
VLAYSKGNQPHYFDLSVKGSSRQRRLACSQNPELDLVIPSEARDLGSCWRYIPLLKYMTFGVFCRVETGFSFHLGNLRGLLLLSSLKRYAFALSVVLHQ